MVFFAQLPDTLLQGTPKISITTLCVFRKYLRYFYPKKVENWTNATNEKETNPTTQESEQMNGPSEEKNEETKPAEGADTSNGTGEPVCRLLYI